MASSSPPSMRIMRSCYIPRAGFPVNGYTTNRFGADIRVNRALGIYGGGQRQRFASGAGR